MAAPSYWKGYLKLSLVTCPVSLTPATTDRDKVRFHTLNRATGHRVASQYVDSETGKAVGDDDEGKGYETADGKFVILEDEDLEFGCAGKHSNDRHRLLCSQRFDILDLV